MASYLPEKDIEAEASKLLESFQRKHGRITRHVPVEDIIERHLGLHLEIFDDTILPEGFNGEVLGYLDVMTNIVGIHESILPENSHNIGRYHFTLAHEGGHSIFHRDAIRAASGQLSCFEHSAPRYLAKSTTKTFNQMEWQADTFASYLIMPGNLIHSRWKETTGSMNPLTFRQISETFTPKNQKKYRKEEMAGMYLKKMAQSLGVSQQALVIRLKKHGATGTA